MQFVIIRLTRDGSISNISAGLFSMTLPRDLGGAEVDPTTVMSVVEEIAWADPSLGWALAIGQASGFLGWGSAELAFACAEGETRLVRLRQRAPMRVLFPRQPAGDIPMAALVNVGGGLVTGDRVAVDVTVGPGAAALVTSQAAEKVYRSTGAETSVDTRLAVAEGGWLGLMEPGL